MTVRHRADITGLTPALRRNICELDMVQFGTESCAPGHSFGPAVRDHWLIHYVLEGCGRFSAEGREYTLGKGDGFLICPNRITWYGADWEAPWRYTWIGFSGARAAEALRKAGLDEQQPLFHMSPSAFAGVSRQMGLATGSAAERDFRLMSALYLFFAELVAHNGPHDTAPPGTSRRIAYVRKAADFFRMYYARPIGITEAAAHVGLDRSYLSQIFKEETGVNPRDFLIGLRLEKACQFMGNPALSIADIARSVGYEDPLRFSKLFHKHRGLSPRAFRKELLATPAGAGQGSGSGSPNP
jgi:AraC-like DNA-binding protein